MYIYIMCLFCGLIVFKLSHFHARKKAEKTKFNMINVNEKKYEILNNPVLQFYGFEDSMYFVKEKKLCR